MATVELKKTTKHEDSIPYFLLVSRLLLFFLFQALIAEIVHWIYPTKLDDSSILEALENGCFYASKGPEIKDYQMGEDMKIKIECSPVKKLHLGQVVPGMVEFSGQKTERIYIQLSGI